MRATLDRGHNIHVPVLHVPLKPTNDRTLHAIVVPVESKCHDLDKQETSDIPPGQYFQAPQKAVIFSPVMGVIFGEAPGRVVRILDNVNIETLKSYATECGQSYDHKLAMLRARGEHPRFTRGVYVKDCKHYIWNHAVTKEGPVPFLAPVLLAQ
ncbi:hypothetical protein APHAL10511_004086 [Amanita phalloides]|nr:hypothetical protein APHAL10511_004086 [Amanita phalloides]